MNRVLVVEDKASLRELLRRVLSAEGWEVVEVPDAESAAEALGRGMFDVVVTDLRLPGRDGHWVLEEAKRQDPRTEVVVLTAYGSIESSVRAVKAGAFDYLTKPVENDHLVAVVEDALAHRQASVGGTGGQTPELLGASPAFREALGAAEKIAQSDATVLLQGESGTGKELFARFIHRRSKRAEKVFVSLNCGALAPTLFESELFGHERGAFTGAVERKMGRFEMAADGTLSSTRSRRSPSSRR
jgi:DNA-binding NtrC family response regulator